jgi:Putative transposase
VTPSADQRIWQRVHAMASYTHRVAIANSRLIAFNESGFTFKWVTFKWKDYRANEHERAKVMSPHRR